MYNEVLIHCEKNLKCDRKLLEKEIFDIKCQNDREKVSIYKTFYNFINNKSCLDLLEKIDDIIKINYKQISKDNRITLAIIILKSFLEKRNNSLVNENYIDSDEILDYILKNYAYYLFLKKIYIKEKQLASQIIFILDILVKKEILIEKKFNILTKISLKTIKYYQLPNIDYEKNLIEDMLFSFKEFDLMEINDEYYITNGHFSKTYKLYKKNFNSNKNFKLKNINYIAKKINIKLFIDSEYQEDLKKYYDIDINLWNDKIKNNNKTINDLFEKENWTSHNKDKISSLQSENAKLTNDILLNIFSKIDFKDNYIYFPMFFDFRGRKYYYSLIGPTSSKIIRLVFYYGYYRQSDFCEKKNKYSLNYYNLIEEFCKTYEISNEKKYFETYFWCLIGIGKFFIEKKNYPISVEIFIKSAIINYNNLNNLEIEEVLEILHYKRIIRDMILDNPKKRVIVKDATASINQILMKYLGPLDQNSMNYVNLGDFPEWYDTYSVSIDLFYDFIKTDKWFIDNWTKEEFYKVLNRKLVKNAVMIIPYSAGNKLCWENYIDLIESKKYNIEINTKLKKLLKNFFEFIRNDIQEYYLYNKTSTSVINKISEDFEKWREYVLESETGIADISYYKMKRSSIDKKYKLDGVNRRITKLVLVPSEAIDKKTFDIATGANLVHFLDADEIRIIENEMGFCVITIHDSYLIGFNECSLLIEKKIEHYQKEINKLTKAYQIKNIFIVL